jgi:hypothetical protein
MQLFVAIGVDYQLPIVDCALTYLLPAGHARLTAC